MFKALFALLGITSLEKTPHGYFLTQEQMTKVDGLSAELATANAAKLKADEDLKTANDQLATAQADLKTAQDAAKASADRVTELETANADLKAIIDGNPADPATLLKTGNEGGATGKEEISKVVNGSAHSREMLQSFGIKEFKV